jgi:hypothetical protein
MSYFYFTEYKITIIDSIKDYAVTDAYLKMFETLYRSGKVPGYIFRQKEQLPVAAEQLPVVSTTATNGNIFIYLIDIRN